MSGNIFVSSTVPGIKDRDGDKDAISYHKQPYYLSRTDYSTAYWVKLMIGSTLLMLVVPIFLAHLFLAAIRGPQVDTDVWLSRMHPLILRPGWNQDQSEVGRGGLAEIDISRVLTRALSVANGTRDRGVLVHALLELQNPELTGFAGAGYGVYLKQMNRGAELEAFPEGMVPMCGAGGRFDEWGRVRGLRYAYQWIDTGRENGLIGASRSGEGRDGGVDVESLLMGWPALLLERAGVSDPMNPVAPGSRRNVYGEAVDRVVGKLCDRGGCEWGHECGITGESPGTEGEEALKGKAENAEGRLVVQERSERGIRPVEKSLALRTDSIFIRPPFLALYAVARQDRKWLVGAVEQIRAHFDRPAARSYEEKSAYWVTATAESVPTGKILDTQQEYISRPGNNAWTWAGIVRVLSVLEKWKPRFENSTTEEKVIYENWRNKAVVNLREMLSTALVELRDEQKGVDDVLRFCGDESDTVTDTVTDTDTRACKSSPRDPARTALLVGSVYRLAQLNMLDDLGLLEWIDKLYNAVAGYIGKEGEMVVLSDEIQGGDWHFGHSGNEDQSMVIMMWAARRDCAKVGVCRVYQRPSWWDRLRRRP